MGRMQESGCGFSVYLHVPYCRAKCPYCDFNVHVVRSLPEIDYAAALIAEMRACSRREPWRDRSVRTVFFGGGTPSLFSPDTIARILDALASCFPLDPGAEISLEANPEDAPRFPGYRARGVNRLSIGVQSFEPALLRALGRRHSPEEIERAVAAAGEAGFENFNLDLIYGIPGQDLQMLERDLDRALGFSPPHLSAYALAFEEGTPLYRRYRAGRLSPVEEEIEARMAELVEEKLASRGLLRYEISNYARPGFACRHNLQYWTCGDYLGIGAGAHSHWTARSTAAWAFRWENEKRPRRYMERIARAGRAVARSETLSRAQSAAEFMLMGLRLSAGVSASDFLGRFGAPIEELFPRSAERFEQGLLERAGDRIRLAPRARLLLDSLALDFC
jgi:putative oxygen-independent coproporphyrinogen III oxidase